MKLIIESSKIWEKFHLLESKQETIRHMQKCKYRGEAFHKRAEQKRAKSVLKLLINLKEFERGKRCNGKYFH